MRIFRGSKDNWTPIDLCKAYIDRLQQTGVDIALYEYPDAFHSFDDPNLPSSLEITSALTPRNCNFIEQDGQIIDPETGQEPTVNSACVKKGVLLAIMQRPSATLRQM